MKVLVACLRGKIASRDKWGHCLCGECKAYRYMVHKKSRPKNYQIEWQRNNKDKTKGYVQKWISENKEKRIGIVNSWRKCNPEKVKAMNSRGGKKWYLNNKPIRNAINAKRRASLLGQTPIWADFEKIKSVYKEAARITRETGIPHEVDHITPLRGEFVSGLHIHDNLRVITRSKNRSKKNRMESLCVC